MFFRLRIHRDRHWKFSFGFSRTLFRWIREGDGWLLFLLGIRLHWKRLYGVRTGKHGVSLTAFRYRPYVSRVAPQEADDA